MTALTDQYLSPNFSLGEGTEWGSRLETRVD